MYFESGFLVYLANGAVVYRLAVLKMTARKGDALPRTLAFDDDRLSGVAVIYHDHVCDFSRSHVCVLFGR